MTEPAPTTSPDTTSATAPTPIADPIAVFIGDSYTAGFGTTLDGHGFPGILGTLRGWEVINLGIPGIGYATNSDPSRCPSEGCIDYASAIPRAASYDPDIVVISGGRNDVFRNTIEEIEPFVSDFFHRLRQALPETYIIVTSPIWDDAVPPTSMAALSNLVEREASLIDAEFLDLADPLQAHPELIAVDGMHPNEAGLQVIAERIDELLGDQPTD